MRKFNLINLALLGLFLFALSSNTKVYALSDNHKEDKRESVKFALANLKLKSILDITALPAFENWDANPNPVGWTYFTNSDVGSVTVQSSTSHSADNAVKLSNGNDETSDFILVSPGTTISTTGTRVRFYAKANTMFPNAQTVKVGIMTDPNNPSTYTNLVNKSITNQWEEYIADISAAPPQSGTFYIAIKADFNGTNKHIYIDDFTWEEIPTGPVLTAAPATINLGMVFENEVSEEKTVSLKNTGIETINVTNLEITGANAAEFSITDTSENLPFTLTANSGNQLNVSLQYTPQGGGVKTASLDVTTDQGLTQIPITAETPEGLVEIGTGNLKNTHLPMEPWYGYSYSQSIYLQSEIDKTNSMITHLYYQKTSGTWDKAGDIKIYMGHTSLSELSDWIPFSDLTEVNYIATLPKGDANGWVEFILDEPFIYNNADNLVIAFDENKLGCNTDADDFYCHEASQNISRYFYNDDINPDPANPPTGGSYLGFSTYRPNIRLIFAEVPAQAIPVTNFSEWQAGMRPVGISQTSQTFKLTNHGSEPLTVSGITDLSGTPFSTTFVPADVNLSAGFNYEFTFTFSPTEIGTFEQAFVIETNGGNVTIMLHGNCDYELPANVVEIGWDTENLEKHLPMSPADRYSYSQSIYKQNEINVADQAIHKIFYHQKTATAQNDSVKIYMGHTTKSSLENAWINGTEIIQVFDGNFAAPNADGWVEISLDNPFVYNNIDNLVIAFLDRDSSKYTAGDAFYQTATEESFSRLVTNNTAPIDPNSVANAFVLNQRPNIRFEFGDLPAEPVFDINLLAWDAGMVPGNQSKGSGNIFKIRNLGGGTLNITGAVLTNNAEFSTSLPNEVSLAAGEEYPFSVTYSPTTTGTHTDILTITHANGSVQIALSGHSDYVVPENMVAIGQGTSSSEHFLPMKYNYGYSYSQSIYLQNEIMKDNMQITKLYYRKTSGTLEDAGNIKIYMGYTTLSELSNWIPLSDLTEVAYSETFPTEDSVGWAEFVLDKPFIYNNSENLVIAFDENKPGYDYSVYFYNHAVSQNMSKEYHSDGNNPDPAYPPEGTLRKFRPDIRLQFEDAPTTPVCKILPQEHDFGNVFLDSTSNQSFIVINVGIDTLKITNIYLGGENADQFSLSNLPTFPTGLINSTTEKINFDLAFTPTEEGDLSAIICVEHSQGIDTVMLSGKGYNQLITALPFSEYFDDSTTTIVPELTLGWNSINTATTEYAKIRSYSDDSEDVKTLPNSIELRCSSQPDSTYMLIAPPTALSPENTRVRFYAKTFTEGVQIITGYFTDEINADNFMAVDTVNVTTDFEQFIVDLSQVNVPENTTWNFGFQAKFSGTYQYIYMDNVVWEEIPTEPVFDINLLSWDAGMVPGNQSKSSGNIFKIKNIGVDTLTITDAVFTNNEMFSTSLMASDVSLAFNEVYPFSVTYLPTAIGEHTDTLTITHANGSVQIALSGHSDYILPENMVEIGQGTASGYFLPMSYNWGYSYSQSIYLQNEIMKDNMQITKLYYRKTSGALSNAGDIKIYMGYTTLSELSDWIPLSDLTEVAYSETFPTEDSDGWAEFILDEPFVYNNIDNLVIAFDENKSSYNYSIYFYNHAVSQNMSKEYHNDSNNPDPASPPDGTLHKYRPDIRLQFEDGPDNPICKLLPEEHNFGVTFLDSTNNYTFTVKNIGVGTLTVDSIYLGGENANQFSISNLPTFPTGLINSSAENINFDVKFMPTIEGYLSAKVYVAHSEGIDSIMLNGKGYNLFITELPFKEYFDNPETTTVPEITFGWETVKTATSSYATIETVSYTSKSAPNSIDFYPDNYLSEAYMLVSPPTRLSPENTRIRFYARGSSSGAQIITGYFTDEINADNFIAVDTVSLTTDFSQFFIDLSSVSVSENTTWHFGFKAKFSATSQDIFMDNVTWETIPTGALFEVEPMALNFNEVELGEVSVSETVVVTNLGVSDLIITGVDLIGADAADFNLNVIDALNDTISNQLGDNLTVQVSFAPTSSVGEKTADLEFTDVDMNTYTIPLSGIGVDYTMIPDTLITFNNGIVPPAHWTMKKGLLADTVAFEIYSYGWADDDFSNISDSTKCARLNIYGTNIRHWLITSAVDLGDGSSPVILEFDLSKTKYSNTDFGDPAPDDKFAVLIKPEGENQWLKANTLRLYDNTGSEYVFDNIPNGSGEHVEISLGAYTGLVKIAFYGESTETNGDNNLYVDNVLFNLLTPDEVALNEAVLGTSITATPGLIIYEEGIVQENVIDYAVDYPTPFNENLDANLLLDYMLVINPALPNGATVDIEIGGANIGQITSDATQTPVWISETTSATREALNTKTDETLTLKVNGLNNPNSYDIVLNAYTALADDFNILSKCTLLAKDTAMIKVTPTPLALPVEEDFANGLPVTWSTSLNGSNGAEWTYMTDSALNSTTGNNGYMKINDFAVGADGMTNSDLIVGPIDISNVTGTLKLEFEHYYHKFTSDVATVYVSADAGTTWQVVKAFTTTQGSLQNPKHVTYNIAIAQGQNSLMVRWNFNDGGSQTFDWSIDDVRIYEDQSTPSDAAEIVAFDIPNQVSSSIDAANASIDVIMPANTDLTALVPAFTLSANASASIGSAPQTSGVTAVNFTGSSTTPVVYTVTAQSSITKNWNVSVSCNNSIGIDEAFNLSVYPNPSNGLFTLNVYSENGFTYCIYNTNGEIIKQNRVKSSGEYTEAIDLNNVAKGVYTLKVNDNNTIKVVKLVVQ